MNRICIALAFCLMVCVLPAKASSISFEFVDSKFGSDSSWTNLRKKEEWKKYKGKCVEWTGKLVYLDEAWGKISLGFKHKDLTWTYDVLVSAPKSYKQHALTMEQGSFYNYKMRLDGYAGAILPITGDLGCD